MAVGRRNSSSYGYSSIVRLIVCAPPLTRRLPRVSFVFFHVRTVFVFNRFFFCSLPNAIAFLRTHSYSFVSDVAHVRWSFARVAVVCTCWPRRPGAFPLMGPGIWWDDFDGYNTTLRCRDDGTERYRCPTVGISRETTTAKCTSSITTPRRPLGSTPETGE